MILLHLAIMNGSAVIWAETKVADKSTPRARSGRSPRAAVDGAMHPFSSDYDALIHAAYVMVPGSSSDSMPACKIDVRLPTTGTTPIPSSALLDPDGIIDQKSTGLMPWTVHGMRLRSADLFRMFSRAESKHVLYPGVLLGDEFQFLKQVMQLCSSLLIEQHYLPTIVESHGAFYARWKNVFVGEDLSRLNELVSVTPYIVQAAGSNLLADAAEPLGTEVLMPVGQSELTGHNPTTLLTDFLDTLVDDFVRYSAPIARGSVAKLRQNLEASREKREPSRRPDTTSVQLFDSVHDCWLAALQSPTGLMTFDVAELSSFAHQVQEWQRPISALQCAPMRLCFRLDEPPESGESAASKSKPNKSTLASTAQAARAEKWKVSYFLQDIKDQSLLIPAAQAWRNDAALKKTFANSSINLREFLLLSLGQASALCSEVADSLRSNAPDGFCLNSAGAFEFLLEKAGVLRESGFGVMLPGWWTKGGPHTRLNMTAKIKSPDMTAKAGLTLDRIVEFDWKVALGDVPLSLAELLAIADLKAPLVQIRGQWVHVDSAEIQSAIEFLKRKARASATVRDLVRYSLGASSPFDAIGGVFIKADGWIAELLKQLEEPAKIEDIPTSKRFNGQLRPYQTRGFSWLSFLGRWGLGACLADDMGLGKTVQTLAMVQKQRADGEARPVLLVCPTSVVNNWRKEAARFTPDLAVLVHHGGTRTRGEELLEQVRDYDMVISSYALLHRDLSHLQEIEWAGVILDEAQNIKNPATKQSLAARQLNSQYRVALTGTPVENSVADLWSIMEFLNPGLLGSQTSFRQNFFYPIQFGGDAEARERLKRITQPFVLRRLKTDKTIISDLPDKQEMKVYCSLTKEQVTLYTAVLKDLEMKLQSAEGIQRKGLILATLSRLKQVCNHPAHYLADNSSLDGRSGKLERLFELLEEVSAAGEKALIFSQFTEMGELIKQHFEEKRGEEVLFLHGAVNRAKRDAMVERFQAAGGPSLFVLSLKAGGTGLNLTAANHVFHFDRWWNPAVENQASDRAYRIGQTKNVQVRKFICAGTLEEKIDDMIESKRKLAEDVIGSGEGWLTELSNEDLKKVFALSREARID